MGGVTTTTPGNILYGTDGYVKVGSQDIGATVGIIRVEWPITHYYPNLAQARGSVAGTGAIQDGYFRVKVSMAEHSWLTLSAVMGSVGSDSTGSSYKFGGKALTVPTELANVVVEGVKLNSGKAWRATIPACYTIIEGLDLAEGEESTLEITFEGLYTVALPTTLPGYIEIEK
jgi:hypothetical protein